MSKHTSTAPSAPPEEELAINTGPPYPRIEHNEVQQTGAESSGSNVGGVNIGHIGFNQSNNDWPPPPSYQDAVNYPPVYQPNTTFPKPQGAERQPPTSDFQYSLCPTDSPHYNAMPGGGATPVTNNYTIHHPLPQPSNTTTITVVPVGNCIHCLAGNVQSETNICCLLCLIILAICTFPLGLVLLCCISCTVRRRCAHCRRINP